MSLVGVALAFLTFSQIVTWQNSIRSLMEVESVDSAYPWLVAAIALAVALVIIFSARGIIWLGQKIASLLGSVLPRNLAISLGGLLAVVLVFSSVNDFVVQKACVSQICYSRQQTSRRTKASPPSHAFASGGPNSVIDWDDIGTNGKDFLVTGPTQHDIAEFTGRNALEPIRVFAGFGSGEDFEARAKLALEDLINFGGFERSVLIVDTPTGTGWLDPAGIEPSRTCTMGTLPSCQLNTPMSQAGCRS